MRLLMVLLVIAFLVSCGAMAPMPDAAPAQPQTPRTGKWSLGYSGGCTGREAEPLLITALDESQLVFDDFHLLRDEAGHYAGSADFIAPMPADGRDVVYTIAYRLSLNEDRTFVGTETITEGGGHSLDCPVALVYVGAE